MFAHAGPSTEVVTLAGRAVVPGFQDAHLHPGVWGAEPAEREPRRPPLERGLRRARRAPSPRPTPISPGSSAAWYGPVYAQSGGPRKEDLDAVVPDRPVFLLNTDVHRAWVNSRGARGAGISAATPDPWDGYVVRDPDGTPTGTLQEGAAYDVLRSVAAQPTVDQWKAYVLRAQEELHALGVTGWQDAWVEPDLLRAYRTLADDGALTMRVVASMWWDRHGGMEQVERLVEQREATGGMLHANTIKIMLDGCPESGTGSMLDPYEGAFRERHGRGIQFVDSEALTEAVAALDAHGFQVHQHALGDRSRPPRARRDRGRAPRTGGTTPATTSPICSCPIRPTCHDCGGWASQQTCSRSGPSPTPRSKSSRRRGWASGRRACIRSATSARAARRCASAVTGRSARRTRGRPRGRGHAAPIGEPDAEPLDASQRIDLGAAMAAYARGSASSTTTTRPGCWRPACAADLAVLDLAPVRSVHGAIGETRWR